MPPLSRAYYRKELIAWSFLPVALGAVEGGLAAVIVKYAFTGTVSPGVLNMVVAVLTAAPALANIMSFVWAAISHGRHKIKTLTALQIATISFVALIAVVPFSAFGMWLLVFCVIGARVCWSGVTILRSTVWHANYPREIRATIAGKLATVQSLVLAAVTYIIGTLVEWEPEAIRVIYPVAALIGAIGVLIYSGMRMRGHRALIKSERNQTDQHVKSFNPILWRKILHDDHRYRWYQTWMFIFGSGNLMVAAPLVVMLKDRFQLEQSTSTVLVATIPLLLMPFSIPLWSRLLDSMHIIRFRAIHCWAFVSSIIAVLIAAFTLQPWILFLAATLKGIAFGGGVLGWNLGHHDFAPPEKVSQYMGVHVTLTGIRGMVAPIISIGLYQVLEHLKPGAGAWVFVVCLALSLTGAVGFVAMARKEKMKL